MRGYKELDDELRVLRSKYKANPSKELKEQILLTDKKLRDIENSLPTIYTQDELILTERDKQIFLDAINNLARCGSFAKTLKKNTNLKIRKYVKRKP